MIPVAVLQLGEVNGSRCLTFLFGLLVDLGLCGFVFPPLAGLAGVEPCVPDVSMSSRTGKIQR